MAGLTFRYPGGRTVLDIPNLRIASGESVFLHGPSGSGKSTMLSLVAGVLRPTSGLLQVLGHPFSTMSGPARDRVRGTSMGYIFQSLNLIPYLTVRANIALPCELHPSRRKQVQETSLAAEVDRLAARLDITEYLPESVHRLSVGQQQRVAIARALIGSPALIIADEPTSSLDVDRRDAFVQLLLEVLAEAKEKGRATTLLYVSHDASLTQHFGRHLSLLDLNRAGKDQARAVA